MLILKKKILNEKQSNLLFKKQKRKFNLAVRTVPNKEDNNNKFIKRQMKIRNYGPRRGHFNQVFQPKNHN